MQFFNSAKESLEDLFSIEINTIKKEGMSAQRPPILPWQLKGIVDCYTNYLESIGVCTDLVKIPDSMLFKLRGNDLAAELEKFDKRDANDRLYCFENQLIAVHGDKFFTKQVPREESSIMIDPDNVTNGWTTFEKLRILSKHAYNDQSTGVTLEDEQRIMLVRIRRNCEHIKAILRNIAKNPKNGLNGFINITERELIEKLQEKQPNFANVQLNQITTIRKIWEIGTETVLIQTVIQVEGDVITRITPQLIDDHALSDIRETLFNAHRSSIDVGLTHWKNLIGIVQELARKIF
jgi:hypothetical protein